MIRSPHRARSLVVLAITAILPATVVDRAHAAGEASPAFSVTYTTGVAEEPVSGRLYVMLGPVGSPREPRSGPDWISPEPFFAVDVTGWKPGESLRLGPEAVGFPAPLDQLEPGTYAAQAVLRLNPDTHRIGDGTGNAHGPVTEVEIGPEIQTAIPLVIDQVVLDRPFPDLDRVKLVDIPSPMLSKFHGRPIRHRAAVILPEPSPDDEDAGARPARFPTLYNVPGFGGDHFMAAMIASGGRAYSAIGEDFLRIVLDPDCGTGHHVFADSENNGPHGQALLEELIPYIEAHYPAIPEPGARLLTGHSSGGWSTLWLQVTYPEFFGGVWSTAPDPVDFRDFQQVDIYTRGTNLFRDAEGRRRPLARRGTEPFLWFDSFSKMEDVIGDGGQLHSFEAVFSPRGPDGKPRPLWDRQTGAIDPETAEAWKPYDIRLTLKHNWDRLGPKLAGKLHVYTGSLDTFYLDGAVRLLAESLERLGSDAVVEVVPGKDHGSLLDHDLARRIDREMHDAVSKYLPSPVEAGAGKGGP